MKNRPLILLALALSMCLASSCAIVIKQALPRWKVTLKCNGKSYSHKCGEDTYPVEMEYSVPEFFIRNDGRVVFRFNYKDMGFKLQFATTGGPFEEGQKYSFVRNEEFLDVSFGWLSDGKRFKCSQGWIEFNRSILPDISYTLDFEFDLSASDGSQLQIRKGTLTIYDRVKPRNLDLGLQ